MVGEGVWFKTEEKGEKFREEKGRQEEETLVVREEDRHSLIEDIEKDSGEGGFFTQEFEYEEG